eukprot:8453980-Ditylum_brightwellii.AAC.1
MVGETTYYQGFSTDKLLYEEGTDGVSCGDMTEGVMRGANMMEFVPLHKTAKEVSLALCDLVMSWVPCEIEFLSAEGWYEHGFDIIGGGTA